MSDEKKMHTFYDPFSHKLPFIAIVFVYTCISFESIFQQQFVHLSLHQTSLHNNNTLSSDIYWSNIQM